MAEEKKVEKIAKIPKHILTKLDIEVPDTYNILLSNVPGLPKNILLLGETHKEYPASTIGNADLHLESFLSLFNPKSTLFVIESNPYRPDKKDLKSIKNFTSYRNSDFYIDQLALGEWAIGRNVEQIDMRNLFLMSENLCEYLLNLRIYPPNLEENAQKLEIIKYYYDHAKSIPLYQDWDHLVERVKKCKPRHGLGSIIFRLLRNARTEYIRDSNQLKDLYHFVSYNYNIQKKFWDYEFNAVQETKKFLVGRNVQYNYTYYARTKDSLYSYTCIDKKIYLVDTKTYKHSVLVDMSNDPEFFNVAGFLFYPGMALIVDMRAKYNSTHLYVLSKEDIVRVGCSDATFSDFNGKIHFINTVHIEKKFREGITSYTAEFFTWVDKKTARISDVQFPAVNCSKQHSSDVNATILDAAFLALLCDVQERYDNVIFYGGSFHGGHIAQQLIKSRLYSLVSSNNMEGRYQVSFDKRGVWYMVDNMGLNWKLLVDIKIKRMINVFNKLVHLLDDKKIDVNDKLDLTIKTLKLNFIDKEDIMRHTKQGNLFVQKWIDLIRAYYNDFTKGDPDKKLELDVLLTHL